MTRIQGVGASPYTAMVEQLAEVQKAPVHAAEARKTKIVAEKNEYTELSQKIGELDGSLSKIKQPDGFSKLAVESSHPEVIEGQIVGSAKPGSYEFEVKNTAQADKFVEQGFPDRNETPVGFGYMEIENAEGGSQEVVIEPGSTLNDVVSKINSSVTGAKASVIDTGFPENPHKLLVQSTKTGENSRINIDADTTYMDFENIKKASNLSMTMDDVEITRAANKFNDLVDGVQFDVKNAAPGTRIQVNIKHDVEKTAEGIKEFTDKYNQIIDFAQKRSGPQESASALNGSTALRSVVRGLQSELSNAPALRNSKYQTLAQIGISTNAKSGELQVDESKLKAALENDYEGVSAIFANSEQGEGLAASLAKKASSLGQSGVVGSRMKSLDRQIQSQDRDIETKTARAESKAEQIRKQFQSLDGHMAQLNSQDQFISERLAPNPAAMSPQMPLK
ncbi:MAG: flagellar filament capping protein FliD [Oligoflexales bacterium]|nr:flagellar filament capping protein FliD [Oligoflexales bacterium]